MKTVCSFLTKFASIISWTLSCYDRVIIKGHLPISRTYEFENFVDYRLKIRRADFAKTYGQAWSDRLVEHAKEMAKAQGRLYEYQAGEVDKDAWAREQVQWSPIKEGLVGVLCVMEACPTFKARARRQTSSVRIAEGAATGLILLFSRPRSGFDARPFADVGAVYLPGVCQWPRLRSATTEEARHRF